MKTKKEIETCTSEGYIHGYEKCRKDVKKEIDEMLREVEICYINAKELKKRIDGDKEKEKKVRIYKNKRGWGRTYGYKTFEKKGKEK